MFVRLKWGLEYKGFLVSTDGYMNLQVCFKATLCVYIILNMLQLANTEEFQDGKSNGALGEVFIRYVLPVREPIFFGRDFAFLQV